jgi:ABC-type transport system involved in multi-copper enzyme maturation permease subunit
MWQFYISTVRAGFRSRGIQAILVLGALLVGVAYLSSSFSLRQPKTVALDVGLSGLRFSLVLFSLFWVQELIAREVERRTVVFSLTYPISRGAYLLGRYAGILGLLGLAALLLGLLLWLAVLSAVRGYDQSLPVALGLPYWATIFGLWLDAAVVASFSLWVASFATVPMLPVALGVAFAIGGKSLGAVADYLAGGAGGQAELVGTYQPLIDVIRWVLPDLSRLDWRAWPMYGKEPTTAAVAYSLTMVAAYVLALLSLAVRIFERREFS